MHSYSQYASIEKDERRERERERVGVQGKKPIVFDSKGFYVLSRMLQSQSIEMKKKNQSRE